MTSSIRRATPDDFAEIARLAPLLWGYLDLEVDANDWRPNAERFFAKGLEDNTLNCFVSPHPDNPAEIVAYGIGVIYEIMPALWLPTGRMGYMQWFITTEAFQRQGLSETIASRIIQWFDDESVTRVQLHATDQGKPLYKKLGFEDTWYDNLWLRR